MEIAASRGCSLKASMITSLMRQCIPKGGVDFKVDPRNAAQRSSNLGHLTEYHYTFIKRNKADKAQRDLGGRLILGVTGSCWRLTQTILQHLQVKPRQKAC